LSPVEITRDLIRELTFHRKPPVASVTTAGAFTASVTIKQEKLLSFFQERTLSDCSALSLYGTRFEIPQVHRPVNSVCES
jgi:hypothetical protein